MHAVHTADTHVHIKTMVCPERVFFLNSVISATVSSPDVSKGDVYDYLTVS